MTDSPQPPYCDCPGFHDGSCHERQVDRMHHQTNKLGGEIIMLRDRLATLERENVALRESAELAAGILWMVNYREGKVKAAFHALRDTIKHEGLKSGISRAIKAGYEADHPPGTDWWAGKKEDVA